MAVPCPRLCSCSWAKSSNKWPTYKFPIWKSMDHEWKQSILGINFLFGLRVNKISWLQCGLTHWTYLQYSYHFRTFQRIRTMLLEKHMRRVIFVIAWLGFGYFLYQCCMKLLNDESLTNVRQLFYVSLQPGSLGICMLKGIVSQGVRNMILESSTSRWISN